MKIILFIFTASIIGCTNYDPLPASKCSSIVSHAKKTLGTMADPHDVMMSKCKKATDDERGCAMAATSPFKFSKCM